MTAKSDDNGNKDGNNEKGASSFDALFRSLQGLTTQTLSKTASQYSGNLMDMMMRTPDYMIQMGKAGRYLKDLREVAGLSIDDLASTINLENPDLLRAIEEGRKPVTLDILYRLASFHARHDPLGFIMNFTREYAPLQWQMLKMTGMDKLLISVEREVKFINIYRSRDRARQLSDEQFDRILAFMDQAFDMALALTSDDEIQREPAKPRKPPKKSQPKKTGD
ncbi:MAG: hypothetical protein CMK32_14875 [Porticoccaceae bacterium]|nr:hypothetical protein [Porticoccaceae bacterium]